MNNIKDQGILMTNLWMLLLQEVKAIKAIEEVTNETPRAGNNKKLIFA